MKKINKKLIITIVLFPIFASGADNRLGTSGTTTNLQSTLSISDNAWIGLGASAGRIEFDDQVTDEVNILNAYVGIGTSTPTVKLHVYDNTPGNLVSAVVNANSAGNSYYWIENDAGASAGIQMPGSTNSHVDGRSKGYFWSSGEMLIGTNASVANGGTSPIRFLTGGYVASTQERMTILSDGKVGI